ncbi:MAG: PilZ domain-containing protein [Nitrospirota bacterium]
MKEARREVRTPYQTDLAFVHYGDRSGKRHFCTTVDISDSGIGIISDSFLRFGQFVEFTRMHDGGMVANAVVQWSMPLGDRFRVGLFLF